MALPNTLGGTGFDIGDITHVSRYMSTNWNSYGGYPSIQTGTGRRGGNCLRTRHYSSFGTTFTADSEVMVSFAMRLYDSPSGTPNNTQKGLLKFTRGGAIQVAAHLAAGGQISFTNGSNASTIIGTTTENFDVGTWKQVCIYIKCHASTGSIKVWFDGSPTPDLDLTLDTLGVGADALIDSITFMYGASVVYAINIADFDDILWGTGGTGPDPYGDIAVVADEPISDGSTETLTPSTGTDSTALLVDETDGTTVSGETGTLTMNYDPLPYTPTTVIAVIEKVTAKKDDVGTRQIGDVIDDGVTVENGTVIPLTTDYVTYGLVRTLIDGVAPTKSSIDANEWGFRFTA